MPYVMFGRGVPCGTGVGKVLCGMVGRGLPHGTVAGRLTAVRGG